MIFRKDRPTTHTRRSSVVERNSVDGSVLTVDNLRTELDRFARIHLRAELELVLNSKNPTRSTTASMGLRDMGLRRGATMENLSAVPEIRMGLRRGASMESMSAVPEIPGISDLSKDDIVQDLSGRSSVNSFRTLADMATDAAAEEIDDPRISNKRRRAIPEREDSENRPIIHETTDLEQESLDGAEGLDGQAGSSYIALATNDADPDNDDAASSLLSARQTSIDTSSLSLLARFVHSGLFDYMSGTLIVSNAVLLGLETDYCARHGVTSQSFFETAQLVFCALFFFEISLRLHVNGWKILLPYHHRQWAWNLFDACVVACQIVEALLRFIHLREGHSIFLHVVRVVRLIRIFRLGRLLHHVAELRMLVNSLAASVHSLAWTILLVLIMTYMFGIYLTQLATETKIDSRGRGGDSADLEVLLQFFGSLDRSVLSLYEAISEGIHWSDLLQPLVQTSSPWIVIPFAGYMSFMLFALMNVVTGIFVDSATRAGQESEKKILMGHMSEIFHHADSDQSGSVTIQEFEAQLKEPAMRKILKSLDMDSKDARELFHLLDTEESGEVEHRDFVRGCRKLQGGAKAIDLRAMMQELRRFINKWEYHSAIIEDELTFLVAKGHEGGETGFDQKPSLSMPSLSSFQRGASLSADP